MHLKISSAKWLPFCPGGDELTYEMSTVQGQQLLFAPVEEFLKQYKAKQDLWFILQYDFYSGKVTYNLSDIHGIYICNMLHEYK